MATGNHFWLDIVAGVAIAGVATSSLAWWENRCEDARARSRAERTLLASAALGLKEIQTRYTTGVRRSRRSAMSRLGAHEVTPTRSRPPA